MLITARWMRGGTSKCWVFEAAELERTGMDTDALLCRLFGSPDPRQLDGVGGGTSTTSKALIVGRGSGSGVDISFTFAQVGVEEAKVDWGSNCGNCSAAVGLYAIEQGWVPLGAETTEVRTFNTNTSQIIVQTVPTPNGRLPDDPQALIPGAVFPGHSVELGFLAPEGKTTGSLLPASKATSILEISGGRSVVASMVDAGAPIVMVDAKSFGLDVQDYESWVSNANGRLAELEEIRRAAAVAMGLADTPVAAERAIPKIGLVSESPNDEADLQVLMMSMGKPHPAMPITGSVGVTVAAHTEGTVVADSVHTPLSRDLRIRIPVGVLSTFTEQSSMGRTVGVQRTARTLADAQLPLPDGQMHIASDPKRQEAAL